MSAIRPRFGKVSEAIAHSSVCRSRLYEWAGKPENAGLIKKNGAASIVDFNVLDRILDDLPVGPDPEMKPGRAAA
jgi:hypothetical protein